MGLIGAIKREIRAIDKDQPIAQVQTLDDKLSESIAPQRFTLLLLSIFGLIAISLASAGIYGVMSYAVTQRTHEIGVRMALGAQPLDVLKLMVRQGMFLVVVGVVLGLAGAFATTRLMTSLLFEVTEKDPITFAVVTMVLTIVAFVACYIRREGRRKSIHWWRCGTSEECRISNCGFRISNTETGPVTNPKSAIRNPQFLMEE